MTKISTFLSTLRNDVFKLLPMKEAFNEGRDNHISEYISRTTSTPQKWQPIGEIKVEPLLSIMR